MFVSAGTSGKAVLTSSSYSGIAKAKFNLDEFK